MDFGKAFTYMIEDPDWTMKMVIGALIVLITPFLLGIPFLLLLGYQVAITRQVMEDEVNPLPSWDDIGRLFIDGLNMVIALLVYSLPAWVLLCVGFAAIFLPALSGGDEEMAGALAGIGIGIYAIMFCLFILVALVLAFITPALNIQYARTGQLGSLFRFAEIVEMTRENLAEVLLSVVALIGANLVLQLIVFISFITICGPFILGLVGPVWILAATGHLYGQIGAKEGYTPAPKPAL